jgi:hypothetical protein
VNPALLPNYRFRPELVHRRAALSTTGKTFRAKELHAPFVQLRRNRKPWLVAGSETDVCGAI